MTPTKTDLEYDALKGHKVLFDADDTQPDYIGIHQTWNAATSDVDWIIYKFTYSGTAVTQIQKRKGVWDDRVSLFA